MSGNSFKAPSRVYTDDLQKSRSSDYMAQAILSLSSQIPIKNSVTIEALITTSDTIINHGLGRIPVGYLVIDRNSGETVFTSSTDNRSPDNQLILKATGSVTAKVLVF
jgi:hypothetical protein